MTPLPHFSFSIEEGVQIITIANLHDFFHSYLRTEMLTLSLHPLEWGILWLQNIEPFL